MYVQIQFKANSKPTSDCKLFFTPVQTEIKWSGKCWTLFFEFNKYSWTNIAFVFVTVSVLVFAAGYLLWMSFDLLICHSETSCTVCIWSLCCVSWGWVGRRGSFCPASELKRSTSCLSHCSSFVLLGKNPGRGKCKVLAWCCHGWRDHSVSLCLLFPFMKADTSLQAAQSL